MGLDPSLIHYSTHSISGLQEKKSKKSVNCRKRERKVKSIDWIEKLLQTLTVNRKFISYWILSHKT
jgi:hypothetical protein